MLTIKPLLPKKQYRPQLDQESQRVILLLSLMLMLASNFGFTHLVQTFYQDSFHDITRPGFWIIIGNSIILYSLFLLIKETLGWTWSEVGLAKPIKWWHPVIGTAALSLGVIFIVKYLQPLIYSFTSVPNIDHLLVLRESLPLFLVTLLFVWLYGAFVQELVFRAFFINAVDNLLGRNNWSTSISVVCSSLAFGLLHAWQGWGGIILTFLMGILFGTVYVLNGRRIWSLILVHGLIDTLFLLSLYNG